ncbi:glycosyltransferase family 4 protein [Spirosoma pulveris]
MRVLLIHNYYQQRGGEDVIFEQEVDLLRENGISVETLIFTNDQFDGTMLGNTRSAIQSFFNRQSAKRLDLAIRQFSPDVVHIHNLFYTASAAVIWAAKKRNIPVVMTLHNYRLVCINGLLMREGKIPCEQCLTKLVALPGVRNACFRNSKAQSAHLSAITLLHKLTGLWQRVDRFVVVTDFARQKIHLSSLLLRPDQLSVKPNFVADAGYVNPQDRDDFFLYIGRLTFEKGIGVLLNAAETDGFSIDIIGDGPLVSDVIQASEHTSTIRYRGQQPRSVVLEALKRCRALLVPSLWYEGLPTVILEAFATGTPIICSDQQNLNEIVKDNHTGLLFRTGDSGDLCRVIRNFRENRLNQERLGQNAYQEFQSRYTHAISLRAILTIYEDVIAKQRLSDAVEEVP